MHTYLDCCPCFVRQALEALKDIDLSFTPPQIGDQIHLLVRRGGIPAETTG